MTQEAKETAIDEPKDAIDETAETVGGEIDADVEFDEETVSSAAAESPRTDELDEDQWQTGPTAEDISDEEEEEDTAVGCAPHTESPDEEGTEETPAESEDEETSEHTESPEEKEASETGIEEQEPLAEADEETEPVDEEATAEETEVSEKTDEEQEPGEDELVPTVESVVEAILFASDEPLTSGRLAKIVESTGGQVRKCIEALNAKYEANHNAFRIEQIAGGYQMLTLSTYNQWLSKMLRVRSDTKLSPAAMETLAIIAYKQPVIRVDIEAIRGVAVGEVIRSLMYKGLVKIVGRAEILGRPMLYGTTKKFLEVFGLNSLKDLPKAEELRRPKPEPEPKTKSESESEPKAESEAEAESE